LKEEMERAKYDAEMKAVAEEEAAKSQTAVQQPEKIGIEKRIREGKDDNVFKVCIHYLNFLIWTVGSLTGIL
jgi:hypothetical protein